MKTFRFPVTFGFRYDRAVGVIELSDEAIDTIEQEGDYTIELICGTGSFKGRRLIALNISPIPYEQEPSSGD